MEKFKKITYDIKESEVEDLLVDKVKENVQIKVKNYKDCLLSNLYNCESPIEQLLALEMADLKSYLYSSESIKILNYDNQVYIKCGNKKYRVDFLMEIAFKYNNQYDDILKLVIECDGHDFHEKSKEQVIQDNERDRDLQEEGYEILHFSGSEIYNDSLSCCAKILKYIKRKYMSYVKKINER